MQRNLKRLALALTISSASFAGTLIWFESGKTNFESGDRSPIARLNDSSNDVQRKPLKRVIWESISKNDELFPGEAIRTTENAEARIQLIKTGTVIHLESNSLVVLEENEKGMSLDFLEGNMFVTSTTPAGSDGLTLKTGSGEVKLNAADISLSRDQDGKVDLTLFKGQAELKQGSKKIALDKDKSATISDQGLSIDKDRIQILYPLTGESVLLNLTGQEKLEIAFRPLPTGYKVYAEWGASRSNLKPAGETVKGETGRLSLAGKSGKWFFRLTAKSDDPALKTLGSLTVPVVIDPKSPPSLTEPKSDTPVLKENASAPVHFRWLNRHDMESQVLEIAADPRFKKVLTKQSLKGDVEDFATALNDGTYYWRVTGFLKLRGKSASLSSNAMRFQVQSNFELRAPVPIWPLAGQALPIADVQKGGVTFKWQLVAGVKSYDLSVEEEATAGLKKLLQQTVDGESFKVANWQSGSYRWKISSTDPKGGESKSSNWIQFSVQSMPKLEWVESNPIYEYPTPTPSLHAEWKADAQAASYRFRILRNDEDSPWLNTRQNFLEVSLTKDGAVSAVVEALNAKGQTIAQSESRSFLVKKRPLLPAPKWATNAPDIFKTDAKGNLSFGWQEVEGAQKYLMILESEEGKVIERKEVQRNAASVSSLKPGQYKVRLKSVDQLQRLSDEIRTKDLIVPALSEIQAPKIKNMKVK